MLGALRMSLLQAGMRAAEYAPAELGAVANVHLLAGEDEGVGDAAGSAQGGAAGPVGAAASSGGQGKPDIDWSKVNAKHRTEGVRFCSSCPH